MSARGSGKRNPRPALAKLPAIPEQLFQLPPDLDWKRTFLDQKSNHWQYFRSKSAPAAFRTVTSHRSAMSTNDSNCTAGIGESDSEKLCGEEDACSVNIFSVGDTVAATSDFRIGGELAVEKGCRGKVMCHGERPDGSKGICIQFYKWKKGRAATVLCQPTEIQIVEKAPSAESFIKGNTVAVTSDFCIGGVLVVEKGCRGKVMSHGEMPDGNKGVCVQFDSRKDGSDAYVLCQPHQIQVVYCAGRSKSHVQVICEYISLVEYYLESAWIRIRSVEYYLERAWVSMRSVISLMEVLLLSVKQFMFENFATRSFSSGVLACISVLLSIFAIGNCAYCIPSIPDTEKVFVEDAEVYSRIVGHSQLNQCVSLTRDYRKIGSKKNITVCGTQTKVILFLKSNCEAYSDYQHEIGTCNATEASSTCVTASPATETSPATENAVRWHRRAQSYMIKWCSPSIGFLDTEMLWQRMYRIFGVHSPMPNEN